MNITTVPQSMCIVCISMMAMIMDEFSRSVPIQSRQWGSRSGLLLAKETGIYTSRQSDTVSWGRHNRGGLFCPCVTAMLPLFSHHLVAQLLLSFVIDFDLLFNCIIHITLRMTHSELRKPPRTLHAPVRPESEAVIILSKKLKARIRNTVFSRTASDSMQDLCCQSLDHPSASHLDRWILVSPL